MDYAALAAIGLFAGIVSVWFGVGGGIVVVPALLWLSPFGKAFDVRLATGTSLAFIVPTAIVGAWRTAPGQVDWKVAAILAAGAVVGAFAGAAWKQQIPAAWLQRAFAVLLAIVAMKLYLDA